MSSAASPCGGMSILSMSGHGQAARATSCDSNPETVGCELAVEVLRSFGELRFRANGSSMLPAIWPGDTLHVSREGATEALPGEIVLFERGGRLVAHRVVEVRRPASGARSRKAGDRSEKLEARSQEQEQITNCGSLTPNPEPLIPILQQITNRKSQIANAVSRVPCPGSRVQLVTRGDSLGRNDPPISRHELLGRVVAIERGSRHLSPRRTSWQRIGAAILSRSEFCTRVVLGLRLAGLGIRAEQPEYGKRDRGLGTTLFTWRAF